MDCFAASLLAMMNPSKVMRDLGMTMEGGSEFRSD